MAIPEHLVAVFLAATVGSDLPLGLPPAICARETGFEEDAVNEESGARGIAQFMPETWDEWGGGGDPLNVYDAIPVEVAYLCWLKAQLASYADPDTERSAVEGDVWIVALAYHWGINNVRAWLEQGGHLHDLPDGLVEYADQVIALTFEYDAELRAALASIGCGDGE
jgi:soluble lytic murein transglycosylase-like protein